MLEMIKQFYTELAELSEEELPQASSILTALGVLLHIANLFGEIPLNMAVEDGEFYFEWLEETYKIRYCITDHSHSYLWWRDGNNESELIHNPSASDISHRLNDIYGMCP